MGLIVERKRGTTEPMAEKPQMCWHCKERKQGLFTIDANGNQICADCADQMRRPIR
jgi:hypothetical protein